MYCIGNKLETSVQIQELQQFYYDSWNVLPLCLLFLNINKVGTLCLTSSHVLLSYKSLQCVIRYVLLPVKNFRLTTCKLIFEKSKLRLVTK
jgi:hypothetical protein